MEVAERERLVAEGLVGIREAQRFTGLSKTTLYGWMARRRLPFVILGRRRLIPKRALVELAAASLRGLR